VINKPCGTRNLKPVVNNYSTLQEIYGGSSLTWGTVNKNGNINSEYDDLEDDAYGLSWSIICKDVVSIKVTGINVGWITMTGTRANQISLKPD
jgi:hypothetical protein